MPNGFVLKKYVEDKGFKPREYPSAQAVLLAERGYLVDYPDSVFIAHEIDGAGNIVPNKGVDPRLTLKAIETEGKMRLGDIIGTAKAINVELDKGSDMCLDKVRDLVTTIQNLAERINGIFK